ncbi:Inosine triphosphate pyrophosphatase, partial [Geodia barretti]
LNNLLAAYSDKTAFAQCTFASVRVRSTCQTVQGSNKWYNSAGPRTPGFCWDPIFQQRVQLTYAEMESGVKNTISHRYKALCALRDYLTSRGEGGVEEEGEGGVREDADTNAKRAKLE